MSNWIKVKAFGSQVGVDLDPDYTSALQEAWLYVEMYFSSAMLAGITLGNSLQVFTAGGYLCGGDSMHLGIKNNAGTYEWRDTAANVSFTPLVGNTWYRVELHIDTAGDLVELRVDGVDLGSYAYSDSTVCLASPIGINGMTVEPGSAGPFGDSTKFIGTDNLAFSLMGWVGEGQGDTVVWDFETADPLTESDTNYPDPPFWYGGTQTSEIEVRSDAPGPGPGFPAPPVTPDDPSLAASVIIDDVDVTSCVLSGSVTRRLNRPWSATWRMPSDCDAGGTCSRVKIFFGSTLWFHGFIDQLERQCDEDMCYTEYTATDPMSIWQKRPARDGPASADPGDMTKPDMFTEFETGPQILEQVLLASEYVPLIPSKAEGPLFIDLASATYAGGGVSLKGAPVDWPMTIAEVFELMSSTGQVDAILTPIDSGGNMASLAVYNGDYGTDRTASVSFDYATGDYNVRALRQNIDSTNVCNKLWYYLGPRVGTILDPAGDQHWRTNITGTDSRLPGYPASPPYSDVISLREDSQDNCGVRMEVQIFDAQGDENPSEFVDLYLRRWIMESWLRAQARELVHIQPVRISSADLLPPGVTPVQVGDFDIGDLVTVSAGTIVGGGFTGAQRVYEYTVSWDEDGVVEIGELQTSADQEGVL